MKKIIPFICMLFLVSTAYPVYAAKADKVIGTWMKLSKEDLGEKELNKLVDEAAKTSAKWYDALILFKKYSRLRMDRINKMGAEWDKLVKGLKALEADMEAENKKYARYVKIVKTFREDVNSEAGESRLSKAVDPTRNIAFAPQKFIIAKRYKKEVLNKIKRVKKQFRTRAQELSKHCKKLDKLYDEKEKWQKGIMGANSKLGKSEIYAERAVENLEKREASIANIPNKKSAKILLKNIDLTKDMIKYKGSFKNLWKP
jgi:hypothetical protein